MSLRSVKDRKLWIAMIANFLKGQGTRNELNSVKKKRTLFMRLRRGIIIPTEKLHSEGMQKCLIQKIASRWEKNIEIKTKGLGRIKLSARFVSQTRADLKAK